MKITIDFNKRDLDLLQAFLYNSYDNFYEGIYCCLGSAAQTKQELKQLERIKAAFKPIMESN